MGFDTERKDIGYLLGRLFAIIEKTHEESDKESDNNTHFDHFYSATMSPSITFPSMIRLMQDYLSNLNNDRKNYLENLVMDIMDNIESFPTRLNTEEQSNFMLGYYHQKKLLDEENSLSNSSE